MVGRPQFDWDEVNRFLFGEGIPPYSSESGVPALLSHSATALLGNDRAKNSVALVEAAARLCYMSYGKGRTDINDFLTNILASGHGSVLEHANYSLLIAGVSRSLTHELVRHRAGFSYSQMSQRFVDEGDAKFVVPPALLGGQEDRLAYWKSSMDKSVAMYNHTLDHLSKKTLTRKQRHEVARSALPNAVETRIFVTANIRAWRHFIELRGSVHADAEMQRLASFVLATLRHECRLLFNDFNETENGLEPTYKQV